MTKKTPKAPSEVKPKVDLTANYEVPEGFTEQSGDLVGYYDGESIIQIVPMYVKMFDSSLDANKPSILLTAKLCADARLKDKDGNVSIDALEGDLVGIWMKPGMKGLLPHEGHVCHLVPAGELETGKPNPMAVYKVYTANKAGPRIPVLEDARQKSRGAKTMFDQPGGQATNSHNAF
jgi:hypothetical protein